MNNCPHYHKRGGIALEFCVVVGVFVVFCLFAIEVGLRYADRHMVRYVGYQLARHLTLDADFDNNSDCKEEQMQETLKHMAASKLAAISPTILHVLPAEIRQSAVVAAALESIHAAEKNLATVRFLKHWVLAYPVAWHLVDVRCSIQDGQVSVDLDYYRPSRLPVIGKMLGSGGVSELALRYGQSSSGEDFLSFDRLERMIPGLSGLSASVNQTLQGIVSLRGGSPISVKTTINKNAFSALEKGPWDGKTLLVAPYNGDDKVWRQWAENLLDGRYAEVESIQKEKDSP